MKAAKFDLVMPVTVQQVSDLLADSACDSRIIAGGQTLVPMLAMRVAQPQRLIDLSRITELNAIESTANGLVVRSMVRQSQLEDWLNSNPQQSILKKVLPWIAHRAIRNRGTVCGSIAHADPSAELALALAALQGEVITKKGRGGRVIKAEDFFVGALKTALLANEFIYAVRFPWVKTQSTCGFEEFGYRHGDFAVVSALVIREPSKWIFGFGGIDDTPQRFELTDANEAQAIDFISTLTTEIDVREDPSASAQFRRHLMRSLTVKAIAQTRFTETS